jgi:two-component system, LytTR family, sensor kinase
MKHWFFRYKLYHIPFWFVYSYLWWVVYTGKPIQVLQWLTSTPAAIKFGFYYIFEMAAICFNLYFLIPRLLEKGRYFLYTVIVLALIFGTTAAIVPGYYISSAVAHETIGEMFGLDASYWHLYWGNALPSTAAAMTLGMCIHLARKWVQAKKRQQSLEKEKLETELTFLKNQFNPHFLFNTINSIFFLIHKNPGQASDSLAKFSELLRYQLYECNDVQIPLARELRYLKNFIDLEKLRQNTNVSVDMKLPQVDGLTIAPFVLMTFVENACKHVSRHSDRPNWIRIRIGLTERFLDVDIANSRVGDESTEVIHYGGIGLKNLRRRLDLIYPEGYQLDIVEEADIFSVRLGLTLHGALQPQMVPA